MIDRLIIPILNSKNETITNARNILSMAHNKNIDIIIHSTGSNINNIYEFMEELIEYRINYTSKRIRAYVPVNALGYACLLCLVADEYYASPNAIFSPFNIKIKTNILELTCRDIEYYLTMPVTGSLLEKLINCKNIIDYYYPRFELIIKLHSKYGIKSNNILKYLFYNPSQKLSSIETLLTGSNEKITVNDMINIGAGPVDNIPEYIGEYISKSIYNT